MEEFEQPEPRPTAPRFTYVRRADGSVLVSYGAAPITVLRGRAAERLETVDADQAQRLMARAATRARPPRRPGDDVGD